MDKRFELHIVRDDLIVLNMGDAPAEVCHAVRQRLEDQTPKGVAVLVFNYTEVIDHRDAPPPIVEAADMLREWLEANA